MSGYTPSSHVIDFLKAADKAGALGVLTAKSSDVITVANDIARYALTTAQPGQLVKVESTGMTYIVFPVNAGVRFGSLTPAGSSVITIPCYSYDELQTVTLSPGEIVYTTDTRKLYIGSSSGNVELNSASLPYSNLSNWYVPYEHLMGMTDVITSPYTVKVRSSTGYAAVKWWDGTITIGGTGSPSSDITITKTFTNTSGSVGGGAAPRIFYIWSVASTASTANLSGYLTQFVSAYNITYVDISKCQYLTYYRDWSGASYSYIDVTKNTLLTSLEIGSSKTISELDLSKNSLISSLTLLNSKVESCNLSNNIGITTIGPPPTGNTIPFYTTKLNISGCSSLRSFYLYTYGPGKIGSYVNNLIGNGNTFTSTQNSILYISTTSCNTASAISIDGIYEFVKSLRYFSSYYLTIIINSDLDTHLISSTTTQPYFANGVKYNGADLMNLMISKNIHLNITNSGGTINLF